MILVPESTVRTVDSETVLLWFRPMAEFDLLSFVTGEDAQPEIGALVNEELSDAWIEERRSGPGGSSASVLSPQIFTLSSTKLSLFWLRAGAYP